MTKGRAKTGKRTKRRSTSAARRKAPGDHRDRVLREHLIRLLTKEQAHAGFATALDDFPLELRSAKIPGSPHTPWQLLEHLRIAQWDILEFCRNPRHVSPSYPDGYWPPTDTPPDNASWERSVQTFLADLQAMIDLVKSPKTDLFARIPHGEGQTILREAMLAADHNAYHVGQFILLRRMAGAWG
ncbi:MAG: DinB family protein, partial [Acidobacteriota bacterium]|nr:DinB family protein [Acidobacteriota bacterium]